MSIQEIWNNYFQSFTGKDEGFLRRKMMSFAGVWTAAALSWKYCDFANANYIISAWLLFSLLCAGLIIMQDIIKLKNGNNTNENNQNGN